MGVVRENNLQDVFRELIDMIYTHKERFHAREGDSCCCLPVDLPSSSSGLKRKGFSISPNHFFVCVTTSLSSQGGGWLGARKFDGSFRA